MKRKGILFVLAAICLPLVVSTQKEREVTLNKAITMTCMQSADAAVALNELKISYWEYRTFRADLLSEINLKGTLPNYNKSYGSYQNPGGSYSFVRNNALGLPGKLSIDQNIWFTDGQLSLTFSLDYLKQLDNNGDRRLMSVPITLKLTQPVLGMNSMKWDKRIGPVRHTKAKAEFITATREVTMRAITYYLDLPLAKETLGTAHQNLTNANQFHKVAITKRKMGQISKNGLLQLKLSALNAKATLTEAEDGLNAKMFQLHAFLGVGEDEILRPVVPESVDYGKMGYSMASNKALKRNSFTQNIHRRQLETDYVVATAHDSLHSINLFASVRYAGEGRELPSVYRNLQDNQIVQAGAQIPILDWGKRRKKVQVAKSNRDVILLKIRQEQINFNQDIFLLVEHFNNQARQLEIAKEVSGVAQQRYKTSIGTFLIGKVNTLDLNDTRNAKDGACRKHISELYCY